MIKLFLILTLFFGGTYRIFVVNSKGKVIYKSGCVYTLESAKEWKKQADWAFPENRNSYAECRK